MKSVIFTFSALAVAAAAQEASGLSQCAQSCASNMMAANKAKELGCSDKDLKCLCANPNFTYGLRDCTSGACGTKEVPGVLEYGIKLCQGAGVVITPGGGGNGSSSSGSGDASSASGSHSGAEGSVSTIFTTVTSDGKVTESPVATTTLGSPTTSGAVVTTLTTTGTVSAPSSSSPASTEETASHTSSGSAPPSSSGGSVPTTTSSSGFAGPQRTVAPAGMLVAAGFAALLV